MSAWLDSLITRNGPSAAPAEGASADSTGIPECDDVIKRSMCSFEKIPDEVVEGTRGRYIEAYEKVTGEPLNVGVFMEYIEEKLGRVYGF